MRIFDVHVHVYPDRLAQRATGSIGTFYDGMEAHGRGSLADCLARMDAVGVERFAAHSAATSPHNVESINHFIREAHARHPERIVPFAALHPDMEDMQGTVDGIVSEGFRGIKLHPDMQGFAVDGDRAAPMMEALAGRRPLLIPCGDPRYNFDGPLHILRLRERFPKQPIIAAHFGGWSELQEAEDLLPGHDLMFDTSSTLYQYPPEKVVEVIRRFGVENMIYGSDYPMFSPEEELERFLRLPLTDREFEDILWNNAARLLQL